MNNELLLGAIGLVVLLLAFVVEHLNRERSRQWFNLLNAVGSFLLGVYAILTRNIIFIILEFLWVAVSIYYLIRKD